MSRIFYVVTGIVLTFVGILAVNLLVAPSPPRALVDYSAAIELIEKGEVKNAAISGSYVTLLLNEGRTIETLLAPTDPMVERLLARSTPIKVMLEDNMPSLLAVLISWMPIAVFIWALWFFIGRPVNILAARIEALLETNK